jgi:hypothetical protein
MSGATNDTIPAYNDTLLGVDTAGTCSEFGVGGA